jgi:hypothetical protein
MKYQMFGKIINKETENWYTERKPICKKEGTIGG